MLRINDPKAALDAARSINATADDLCRLAASSHVFVREAVAMHEATPFEVLSRLFPVRLNSAGAVIIACAVVKNPRHGARFVESAALLIVDSLADFVPRDFHRIQFLEALGASNAADPELILPLLDPVRVPSHVRERIARVANNIRLLSRLSKDPAERVWRRARQRLSVIHPESANQ